MKRPEDMLPEEQGAMKRTEDILPEEQDPRFKELNILLQHANLQPMIVDPQERSQVLSRASARLFSTEPEISEFEDLPISKLGSLGSYPGKPNANIYKPHRGRRLLRLASSLAAALVIVALIGFSSLFFSSYVGIKVLNENKSGIATPTVTLVQVPNLIGMTWQEGSNAAKSAGFQLRSQDGTTDGVVVQQSPTAGVNYSIGSAIEVLMKVQMATVPPIPPHSSLDSVKHLLTQSGFAYTVLSDGTNPDLPANTVSHISPASGSSVPASTKITIYVVNYTNGTP